MLLLRLSIAHHHHQRATKGHQRRIAAAAATLLCCCGGCASQLLMMIDGTHAFSSSSSSNPQLEDSIEMLNSSKTVSNHLVWHHRTASTPIESTQDEARRLLLHHHHHHDATASTTGAGRRALAVLVDVQTNGRGTQGRKWERATSVVAEGEAESDGNMYMTIAVPMQSVLDRITITLLPLQIGVLVAERIEKLISSMHCQRYCRSSSSSSPSDNTCCTAPAVTVKWPNDVLVGDKKVSGTLIENETIESETWLLIGIGINVLTAPRNLQENRRKACCIQDFCTQPLPSHTAVVLGKDLASAMADWALGPSSNLSRADRDAAILERWKIYAKFGHTYELRGAVVASDSFQGEKVVVLGIERDGQLRVRGENGTEKLLIAEYMF
jgi:BirA family transcriptional regulator, biotin operon repressor / biotin---[acetyl-CoA-carboxylase] ligase